MKLANSGKRKWKAQTTALYPVFSLKIQFHSYLVENSEKAKLNFYLKSRFSMKPSKFPIYFAHDCRFTWRDCLLRSYSKNDELPISSQFWFSTSCKKIFLLMVQDTFMITVISVYRCLLFFLLDHKVCL